MNAFTWWEFSGQCSECEGELDPNGTCEFCDYRQWYANPPVDEIEGFAFIGGEERGEPGSLGQPGPAGPPPGQADFTWEDWAKMEQRREALQAMLDKGQLPWPPMLGKGAFGTLGPDDSGLHGVAVGNRPPIVCLCGSTRFSEAFQQANLKETLAGRIVLTIGCDMRGDEALGLGPEVKAALDELHLRKVDLADEVLILNVGGYIGESTARELAYAREHGKAVRFLEIPHETLSR